MSQESSLEKPSIWRTLLQRRMLITFFLGFSGGMPLLLTLRTLQAWMTDVGVDLKTIGIFSLAGLPYTFKFVWAPLLDRYSITILGRRRGWLIVSQIALVLSIGAMGFVDPKTETWLMAALAILVSFFSATQDIVIDAYRRETLLEEELGLGSTLYIYGYRIAMWVSGAVALGLAAFIPWSQVYLAMAAVMAACVAFAFWAPEPQVDAPPPRTLQEAIVEPFLEFLKRNGAWTVLTFVLLYKLGDTMAGAMATPFYLKIGFQKVEIAAIAKTLGLFSTLAGSLFGGLLIFKLGINRSLWVFGILQAISTLGFAALSLLGPNSFALACVIGIEDMTGGMGTAAFSAFMATMTNRRFTATQFALLTSLMGIPRVLISAPSGYLAESMGWFGYFVFCAVIAIPGLLLILKMVALQKESELALEPLTR